MREDATNQYHSGLKQGTVFCADKLEDSVGMIKKWNLVGVRKRE